jgi:uncharacterized protein YciI
MRFIVIGRDGTDAGALERRMAARDAHLKLGDEQKAKGNLLMAVAIQNDKGDMNGSVMLVDYASRAELDEWLKTEPYVTGKVWEKIEIVPGKVGPSFEKLFAT